MSDLVLALAVFVLIIGVMLILRARIGEKFEVKYSDILLALIPIVIWLLVTGKIQKFEFAELKIETAFVEASKTTLAKQITPVKLPVESVRMDPKRGIEEIPKLIRDETQALSFQLGYGGYYGPAIEEYLRRLSEYPFFKYVVIVGRDGRFVGMADVRALNSIFRVREGTFTSDDFARWINQSETSSLPRLPGYVSAEDAVKNNTHKQTALEQMEALNVEILPVIDEQDKYLGVVDRSRLTASLIIDVANKVK